MNVSATAMPVARQNSRRAGAPRARTTPLPARATGLIALRMRSAALSSSRAAGSGSTGRRRGSGAASTSRGHDVLGQLEVGGAGLLGLCHLEGLAHDLGDDLRARDARVPLGDRPEQLDEVDELMGLLVHPLEVGLAGEGDERRAVQVGVADRR